MLRSLLLLVLVVLASAQQKVAANADEKGFVLLSAGPDLKDWEGERHAWSMSDNTLEGKSDGSSPTVLVVRGRDFGNFELRFEAKIRRGAVRVKMSGPGPGPPGVALEINGKMVEWFTPGAPGIAAARNTPDTWSEYRVVVRQGQFKLWKDGKPSAMDLVVGDMNLRGSISLHLADGTPSEVALRRIRVKE
jgi:hypothetical protein